MTSPQSTTTSPHCPTCGQDITPPLQPYTLASLQALAAYVRSHTVADIEECGLAVALPEPGRWFDIRHMLDEREHCDDVIEMVRQSLLAGVVVGVLEMHPTRPLHVRVLPELDA